MALPQYSLHAEFEAFKSTMEMKVQMLWQLYVGLDKEQQAVRSQGAMLKERMNCEECLESRFKDFEKVLSDAHEKLEALHGRLAHLEAAQYELKCHCQKQGSALEDLKSSYANLCDGQTHMDWRHTILKEHMEWLEKRMGDAAGHHKKVVEEQAANQTKLAKELLVCKETMSEDFGKVRKAMDRMEFAIASSVSKNQLKQMHGELQMWMTDSRQVVEEQKANHTRLANELLMCNEALESKLNLISKATQGSVSWLHDKILELGRCRPLGVGWANVEQVCDWEGGSFEPEE